MTSPYSPAFPKNISLDHKTFFLICLRLIHLRVASLIRDGRRFKALEHLVKIYFQLKEFDHMLQVCPFHSHCQYSTRISLLSLAFSVIAVCLNCNGLCSAV